MNKDEAYKKGQGDASEGKHNPPHSHTEEFFSQGDHAKHIHENNQSYQDGHNHTTEQKK